MATGWTLSASLFVSLGSVLSTTTEGTLAWMIPCSSVARQLGVTSVDLATRRPFLLSLRQPTNQRTPDFVGMGPILLKKSKILPRKNSRKSLPAADFF